VDKTASSVKVDSYYQSDTASQRSMTVSSADQPSTGQGSTREEDTIPSNLDQDSSHYMGADAVKHLRLSYILNKVSEFSLDSIVQE